MTTHRNAVVRYFPLALVALSLLACSDDKPGGDSCDDGFRLIDGECLPIGRSDSGIGTDGGDDSGVDSGLDSGDDVAGDAGQVGCRELETRCRDISTPQVCADGEWLDSAACSETQSCQSGRCVANEACTPGEVGGCASATAQRICDDEGTRFVERECAPGPFCFRGACGAQVCEPDRLRCGEAVTAVERCDESGESWLPDDECDADAEEVCFEGECVSGCLASIKDPTYIGCEYWSVDLPQFQDPLTPRNPREIPHSVVLANTTTQRAEVTVETQAGVTVSPSSLTIAAGGVETVTFPRLDVEGTTLSNRSFRITSTQPVVAYQFNPLNDSAVFSNDASLLLPASAIGHEYYVMSWPGGVAVPGVGPQTGWFTVVAVEEGVTNVDITFTADVVSGSVSPLQGITAGATRSFPVTQWSVLNFECESRFSIPPRVNDLTGTYIVADRPIVVFGGHEEAVIGDPAGGPDSSSLCCADHLEEQMFPVRSWGLRYLAAHSPPRGNEPDLWRVMASEPGTQIATVPAVDGLDGETLGAGQWVEVESVLSFEITATAPILVAQYLVSQTADGVTEVSGDPAMILAVPVEQFRDEYVLLTPSGYARDYATIVRPAGARIELDGSALADASFTSFGTGEFEIAHVQWSPGPHRLMGADAFGVVMIGYDSAVSYGYPGGLNLNPRRE